GRLQVMSDGSDRALATLRAGCYFGEISVLSLGRMGSRRTASVRSVGYSQLLCLARADLWAVLEDHQAARVQLEAIATRRLRAIEQRTTGEVTRSSTDRIQASAVNELGTVDCLRQVAAKKD
uniref:Cyclic nucleotide-binding domain-containing protein n=1 Tax=Macrostomum lignano TaxID=282301 RepID=A0A1I8GDF0_9PLAT